MMLRYLPIAIIVLLFIVTAGCSSSGNVNVTAPAESRNVAQSTSHQVWGYFQCVADPVAKTMEAVPLRDAAMHLNALIFLEPPPLVNLSLESLEFNGNIIDADIGLKHPFLGLTEFTGFDVCGILITNGSKTGFSDPNIRMATDGDTRLLNPDGYSRWWNPSEFPVNNGTMFSYKDGLLGTPDSQGNFSSTVNGYKYFCDDFVNPDDPMDVVTIANRGMFSAGQKNVRHYTIELGNEGLIFNYAVDASWLFPNGNPPWKAPEDFPPEANRPEPWRIAVNEAGNTLYNDGDSSGGDLTLDIDVYDWFNADMNTIRVESPGNSPAVESTNIVGGGDGFSTYEIEITDATPAPGQIELLISAVSEDVGFGSFIPDINTASYFTYTAQVSGQIPEHYHWVLDNGGLMYDIALEDDMSPALAWESDDELRCYWTADSIPSHPWHPYGQSQAISSVDGGQTWLGYHQFWSHGNDGCLDHAKIFAGGNGNSFAIHPLSRPGGVPSLPHYQAGTAVDIPVGWSWAFEMLPYYDCGEVVCDNNGYVHTYGDRVDGTPDGGIYQQICNQQWTYYNDWSWWDPNDPNPPWPSMWWPLPKVLVAAAPARISDSRSIGNDSSGTIYLAYWGGPNTNLIKVARTTDGPDAQTWESITVFSQAGYSDVRDPAIDIDANDTIHIAFLRHNDSIGNDEVCYSHSTDGGSTWSPVQVIHSTPHYLTDTPVVAYEYLGAYVVAVAYEDTVEEATYFVSSFNGGQTWQVPILFGYGSGSSDKMPDMIEGTDNKLHFAFSHFAGGSDRSIHWRNATLIYD